jgi:hypothetical protein
MKKLIFVIATMMSVIATTANAQDVLTKRNNETIKVKITEIGVDEIKYRMFNEPQGIVYTLDKADITSIKLESGHTEQFEKNNLVPVAYNEQRKQAIKSNFLFPISSSAKLSYERLVSPNVSVEVTTTIIGLSKVITDRGQKGVGLSVGYKMIKQPDYYMKGMRSRHALHGLYAMPAIHVGSFKESVTTKFLDYADGFKFDSETHERQVSYGAFILHLGNQWVFNNRILIDFNVGLGIGTAKSNAEGNFWDGGNYYGVRNIGQSNIFSTSTLKVGYLF